jgi:hypothetical protein
MPFTSINLWVYFNYSHPKAGKILTVLLPLEESSRLLKSVFSNVESGEPVGTKAHIRSQIQTSEHVERIHLASLGRMKGIDA